MLVTLSATLMLVILCVMFHYEAMRLLRRAGNWLHRHDAWHRFHLSILVCGLLIAHVLEVMLFGWAYCGLIDGNDYGAMVGSQAADRTGIDRLDGIVHVFADAARLEARVIMSRTPRQVLFCA